MTKNHKLRTSNLGSHCILVLHFPTKSLQMGDITSLSQTNYLELLNKKFTYHSLLFLECYFFLKGQILVHSPNSLLNLPQFHCQNCFPVS